MRLTNPIAWAWTHMTGYARPGWRRSAIYFHEFRGPRHVQFNLKRYWSPFRLKTWPPSLSAVPLHKRSIGFGVGYISWRIGPSVGGD